MLAEDTDRAMSRENVEVVHKCLRAFAAGDVDSFLTELHETVDWQPTSSVVSADPALKDRCYQ